MGKDDAQDNTQGDTPPPTQVEEPSTPVPPPIVEEPLSLPRDATREEQLRFLKAEAARQRRREAAARVAAAARPRGPQLGNAEMRGMSFVGVMMMGERCHGCVIMERRGRRMELVVIQVVHDTVVPDTLAQA